MITRIVKMTFIEERANDFSAFAASIHQTIRSFDGCTQLTIYRDIHQAHVFFSYSHWESEAHLNAYRDSDFFKKTWKTTKAWFADRAQAWSVYAIDQQANEND